MSGTVEIILNVSPPKRRKLKMAAEEIKPIEMIGKKVFYDKQTSLAILKENL